MLSLSFIREHPDLVKEGARKKGEPAPVDEILRLDAERRDAITRLEQLKAEQNRRSAAMAKSRDEAAVVELRRMRDEVKALEQKVAPIDTRLNALLLEVPNPPDDSVPEGKDASGNVTVRTWGIEDRKGPAFTMRPHYEVAERLGIIDFERAVKVTGSRFVFLKGAGARLERALLNFMMDLHIREHGYTEILPPFLVNRASMTGTGQLPKFEEDLFRLKDEDYFLIPTAEVPLTNLHREETLSQQSLPLRYTAYTPCFRREAGSYGKDTRGLIRQHQFNKVELVTFSTPEESYDELERLTSHAEEVLKRLRLHYRVVSLCTADLGFSAAK